MGKSYHKIHKTKVQKHKLILHRLYGTWDWNKLSVLQLVSVAQLGSLGKGTECRAIWFKATSPG